MSPVNLVGPYGTDSVSIIAESNEQVNAKLSLVNIVLPTSASIEDGLTATSTFSQDSVITMGTGAGEVDQASHAIFAWTVPSGWTSGANRGGIIPNFGGFKGALGILDDNGRGFFGSTSDSTSDIITTSGAISANDRIVVECRLGAAVRMWINSVLVNGTALEEASSGTVDATEWSGGNAGGYISRVAGTVTDGQQDVKTDLTSFSSWVSHGTLGTEQAPVGTWGDMTYYKNQTI